MRFLDTVNSTTTGEGTVTYGYDNQFFKNKPDEWFEKGVRVHTCVCVCVCVGFVLASS